MLERQAQLVLFVRAFELVDRDGVVLTSQAREVATSRAMRITGMAGKSWEDAKARDERIGETILRRANFLYDTLGRKLPALKRILGTARRGSGITEALAVSALGIGLGFGFAGPLTGDSVLNLPFLAFIGWNVVAYLAMASRALRRKATGGSASDAASPGRDAHGASRRRGSGLASIYLKATLGRSRWALSRVRNLSPEEAQVTGEALTRFAATWHRRAGSLMVSRVRRMLHLGALFLASGLLLGLFLRGSALDQPVSWNTTMTALVLVALPRLALVAFETWRGAHRSQCIHLDLQDGYTRRLFSSWRGAQRHIEIRPYGYRPGSQMMATLKTLLCDYVGAQAVMRLREPLPYRATADAALPAKTTEERETFQVIVFDPSRTPEPEVHGRFLRDLKGAVEAAGGRMLVVMDTAGSRRRSASSERLEASLADWSRMVEGAGLGLIELDGRAEELIEKARLAVWPEPRAV